MLAQGRRHLQIELVKGHQATNIVAAGKPTDGVDHVGTNGQLRHEEDLVDRLPGPVRVPERLLGDEDDVPTQAVSLSQEGLPFLVAGHAEDRAGSG